MYCPNCGKQIEDDSVFCGECGQNVNDASQKKTEEILFVPKRKHSSLVKGLLIFFGGMIALILIAGVLISINNPESTPPEVFPIEKLSIKDLDSKWKTDAQPAVLILSGSLVNSFEKLAKNIVLKVNFYSDEASTNLLESRNFTLEELSSNSEYPFSLEIDNFNQTGQFWYTVQAISAENK